MQIHPWPLPWVLPLLCYVIQLLHRELREDRFAPILQVGVLTLSGVPCTFSSRRSVIWNAALETVWKRASPIRKYFVKGSIFLSPNHINEPYEEVWERYKWSQLVNEALAVASRDKSKNTFSIEKAFSAILCSSFSKIYSPVLISLLR